MRIAKLLLVFAVAATLAGVAEARTARISTADLDLGVAADVAILHARLADAAHDVCREGERRTLAVTAERAECAAEALDAAVAAADLPTLSALHGALDATVRYSRGVRPLTPVLVAAVAAAKARA